jgi:hypothetical protein
MKFLSPKEASQIMDVIDKVEILVKKGKPIHEAFAEAIKEAQLNKDKAHLAVRTWNISQFLANKAVRDEIGLEEELPVVDFEKIGGRIKESNEKKKEDEVDPIYLRPPKEEPEAIRFIPHPIFSRFVGVSPRLKYAFEVKAGKVRLWHEVAEWKKLADYIRQELAIKRSQIQNLIREKIIPQLKNPEFDIKIACQHLARTNKGAAAVLVSLVRAKNIDVDGDPYRVKKASYNPKHPFYANLIKVADLIYDVSRLEKLYEGVAKVSRNLFIRFRDRYGAPKRELVREQFEPENKDYGISKNGFYYKKPILNMEVIAPGVVIPNFFRLDERTVKEGAGEERGKKKDRERYEERRGGGEYRKRQEDQLRDLLYLLRRGNVYAILPSSQKVKIKDEEGKTEYRPFPAITTRMFEKIVEKIKHPAEGEGTPPTAEGEKPLPKPDIDLDELLGREKLVPPVREVKEKIEKITRALEQQGKIEYDPNERKVIIKTDSETVEIKLSEIPKGVYRLLREAISRGFPINWSLMNSRVKQEEIMRFLGTEEERYLLGEAQALEQLLLKIKGGQKLTEEESQKLLANPQLVSDAVKSLAGKAELGSPESREILKRVLKKHEDKKLLEGLRRIMLQKPLSPPVEKLKTLFEQVQFGPDGKPMMSEDKQAFILQGGNTLSVENMPKGLLQIVSDQLKEKKQIDWEETDEHYRQQGTASDQAKVEDVSGILTQWQEVIAEKALEEKKREEKEREEKRKEYWKRFEKFFASGLRGFREGLTQIAEGITQDRETLQFGKTPLPEAFKAVMMTKMPEIRSDVRGAAEALRPYFARQDILEQSLKLVTTDPYLAGVQLTGPYAGSRGEVSLPELYRAYTELYQINPELMRDPQVAATVLKKYFAADRALDLSEIIALSKNRPQTFKYGQYSKNPIRGRALPTSLIFGTAGGLTPLIFIRDKKDLPLSMLIGALLGAGMGYFLGNTFDNPV